MQFHRKMVLVQSLILFLFSLMIVYLIQTEMMELYISPKVIWTAKLSAILLAIISLAKFVPMRRSVIHSCCSHNHNHNHNHNHACATVQNHSAMMSGMVQIVIFIIPLMVGFGMQPRILASAALSNSINTAGTIPYYALDLSRSDKLNSGVQPANGTPFAGYDLGSDVKGKSSAPKLVNSVAKETDLMQLYLNLEDQPEQVYNQRWRLTGFVYKDPKLDKKQFVISRFVITCCIVDATPLGIIVESSETPKLKADTWVEVTGILQKRSISRADEIKSVHNFQETDDGVPYLLADSCKIIVSPQDPYLAPPMQ